MSVKQRCFQPQTSYMDMAKSSGSYRFYIELWQGKLNFKSPKLTSLVIFAEVEIIILPSINVPFLQLVQTLV